MTEEKARKILKDSIGDDNGLYSLGKYLYWQTGYDTATLDASFSVEELEAIVWWMKNK